MRRSALLALWLTLAIPIACAPRKAPLGVRPFEFPADTLAYTNQLVWEYRYDDTGAWSTEKTDPPPTYALHCFTVAKIARQFFANARFDPSRPAADDATYRDLVRQVVGSSPRKPVRDQDRVVIPGYADLRSFSLAREELLKSEGGGTWRSYFQRGNWRMVFPFSHDGQESVARELEEALRGNWPPVVHAVTFPSLALNHAVLLFEASGSETQLRFRAYDPNDPQEPITIVFDRASREFTFPRTKYFAGGTVHLYPVYAGPFY
jgi:hypothetical protein